MLASDALTAPSPLDVVSLSRLMERTAGRPEVIVGLIDGPVAANHADLAAENIRSLPSPGPGRRSARPARHARMEPMSPASCQRDVIPRPQRSAPAARCWCGRSFSSRLPETPTHPARAPGSWRTPSSNASSAGARVLNLSVALSAPSPNKEAKLEQALGHAARRGAIVVAAAGNQGTLGSSAITRHPWVIPVMACDLAWLAAGNVQPRQLDRAARADGAGRSHHEPWNQRSASHLRWDERCGAVRHWRHRALVVVVSRSERGRSEVGGDRSRYAQSYRRAARCSTPGAPTS